MSDLLNVVDLTVSFGGATPVVEGLRMEMQAGESVGLVGPSGAGKSLAALALLGMLPRGAAVTRGWAAYQRKDGQSINLFEADEKTRAALRGAEFGYISQDPLAALNPVQRCGYQLRETIDWLCDRRVEKEAVLTEVLTYAELGHLQEQVVRALPSQLSGGQLQRVMIAMALIGKPRLLIADEPTTALDAITQVEIVSLLDRLRRELGMGLLLITHDRQLLSRMTDRVVVLPGTPRRQRPEDKAEVQTTEVAIADGFSALGVSDLVAYYDPARQPALNGCTLCIPAGEYVALVGPSGCGKSTLAKCLVGIKSFSAGRLSVGENALGPDASGGEVRQLTQGQLIFQDVGGSLNPQLRIGTMLKEVLSAHRQTGLKQLLADVGLEISRHAMRYPHQLSGGERQRVVIARALACRPRVLVCDEALSAIDDALRDTLQSLLRSLCRKRAIGLLFITHDLRQVRTHADRVLIMEEGKIVEQGTPEDILNNPQTAIGKKLVAAAMLIGR